MKKKQRFSIRKYKIGAVSILLGAVFLFAGVQTAAADGLDSTASEIKTEQTSEAIMKETSSSALTPIVETKEALVEKEVIAAISETAQPEPVVEQAPSDTNIKEDVKAEVREVTPDTTTNSLSAKEDEKVTPQKEEVAKPTNIDSNTIITVPKVWQEGYKGEGTVVAIIDSGLDINHDVLQITDISTAKYKSKEEIEAAKAAAGITYGQWYNDKVVFGYNYVDVNTNLYEKEKASHGMHVTGIATGNPTKPQNNELIYGVAPEAQVMFMRVFSDLQATTSSALYARAIEDAVKLGADSINLSLGGAAGSIANTDEKVIAAIAAARKAGVSVVIAAGNDNAFGDGHSNPRATDPDYGLVGAPSTAKDAISVASYNNTSQMSQVVQIVGLENDATLHHGKSTYENPNVSSVEFEQGKDYEYVYAGLGQAEDFAGLDLKGKLALIQRGSITFSEKVANATANGAAGVVIFNNQAGNNVKMSLDESARDIPAIFIPQEFGQALMGNAYKIRFNNELAKLPNEEAGKMSDFTSWGLTADGQLKPDVTAPGGSIYSSINDNEYGMMNGTSMAAPHVAGVAVLVKQYLLKEYPDKSSEEIEQLIKALIMSNAKPHVDLETNTYTSPRRQGAGIVDTAASISTGLYVTGSNQYPSISLGNVKDTFQFDVTVHNITNQNKTLHYKTHLSTDEVSDGFVTFRPRELAQIDGETIIVPARSSKTVTITVDASQYAAELSQLMTNGYYLEGFVRFLDPTDQADVVSIPYVGFRGEFQNLPVVEEPVYDLIADGKGGFYFAPKENNTVTASDDVTSLITSSSEKIYSNNSQTAQDFKTLGTFKNEKGEFTLVLDQNGQPHLAISPNNDGNQEYVAFKGVFLRGYENLTASVYAANDLHFENPLWTSESADGNKNFYGNNPDRPKSTVVYATAWFGQDQSGNNLPDAHYKYVLTYYPEVVGATAQKLVFNVTVDREAPVITTATYDETTRIFNPRKAIEKGPAGIYRDQVFYLVKDQDGLSSLINIEDNKTITIQDNKVYVAKNADGTYTLPLDLADIADFYYVVEDYAGNVVSAKVADLISVGNHLGLVQVKAVKEGTGEGYAIPYSFAVYDQAGTLVTELPRYKDDIHTLKLPFGRYMIKMFLYDTTYGLLTSAEEVSVDLTEEVSLQEAIFTFREIKLASLLVDIDKALPDGTVVALSLENGQKIILPSALYSPTDFGRNVPVGNHRLEIALPEGYEFLEELDVAVLANEKNVKRLTLINKTALLSALQNESTLINSPLYYNASENLQVAYQKAVEAAQLAVKEKKSQAEVDQVVATLLAAEKALNGQATDTTKLQDLLAKVSAVQASAVYYNSEKPIQIAYDTTVRVAQLALAKEKVTQVEIDNVVSELFVAQAALNGQATDTTQLKAAMTKAEHVTATSVRYLRASDVVKSAYNQALVQAQEVLSKTNATQEEVDAALKSLQVSEAALDGVEVPNVLPDKKPENNPQQIPNPSLPPNPDGNTESEADPTDQKWSNTSSSLEVRSLSNTSSIDKKIPFTHQAKAVQQTLPQTGEGGGYSIAFLGQILLTFILLVFPREKIKEKE